MRDLKCGKSEKHFLLHVRNRRTDDGGPTERASDAGERCKTTCTVVFSETQCDGGDEATEGG